MSGNKKRSRDNYNSSSESINSADSHESQPKVRRNASDISSKNLSLSKATEEAPFPVAYNWAKFFVNSASGGAMAYVYATLSLHNKIDSKILRYLFAGSSLTINGGLFELISDKTLDASFGRYMPRQDEYEDIFGFFKAMLKKIKHDCVDHPVKSMATLGAMGGLLMLALIPSSPMFAACLEADLGVIFSGMALAFRTLATAHSVPQLPTLMMNLFRDVATSWKSGKRGKIKAILTILLALPPAFLYSFYQHSAISDALYHLLPFYRSLSTLFKGVKYGVELIGVLILFPFNFNWLKGGLDTFIDLLVDDVFSKGWANIKISFETILKTLAGLMAAFSGAPAIAVAKSGGNDATLPQKADTRFFFEKYSLWNTSSTWISGFVGVMMNLNSYYKNLKKADGLISLLAKISFNLSADVLNILTGVLVQLYKHTAHEWLVAPIQLFLGKLKDRLAPKINHTEYEPIQTTHTQNTEVDIEIDTDTSTEADQSKPFYDRWKMSLFSAFNENTAQIEEETDYIANKIVDGFKNAGKQYSFC
jgi:hypothetical protein